MADVFSYTRRFTRKKTGLSASIQTPGMGLAQMEAFVSELGLGGCLLKAPISFGVGRVLPLAVTLKDGKGINPIARVLYERNDDDVEGVFSGVEFINVTGPDMAELEEFIEHLEN